MTMEKLGTTVPAPLAPRPVRLSVIVPVRDGEQDRGVGESDIAAVLGAYDTAPPVPRLVSQYRNLLHHYVHAQSPGDAETFWTGWGAMRREVFAQGSVEERSVEILPTPEPKLDGAESAARGGLVPSFAAVRIPMSLAEAAADQQVP
jgi:hypothetical protein